MATESKKVVYILLREDFKKTELNQNGWEVSENNQITKEYLLSLSFKEEDIKNFIDLGYIKEA
jgi:hypothetical protein